MKRIVILAGGSAGHQIAKSLKKDHFINSFKFSFIVNTSDDGGHSGEIRQKYSIIPPGDLLKVICAFLSPKIARRLTNRDSKGRVKGNLILTEFLMNYGIPAGIKKFTDSFGGLPRNVSILPVTDCPTTFCLRTREKKKIYKGQWKVIFSSPTEKRRGDFFLEPRVQILPVVRNEIKKSDAVVIAPSSVLYSILPILLVSGMKKILQNKKIIWFVPLFCLPTEPKRQTFEFYLSLLVRYGKQPDVAVINNREISKNILQLYEKKGFTVVSPTSPTCSLTIHFIYKDLIPNPDDVSREEPKIMNFDFNGISFSRFFIPIKHDYKKINKILKEII
ncbi:MAG: 2-phospho-L-lactate transferase CofD family protein [Patescibacteria group bacterium]|nr:2-phospho-L-lactate transferase CofD family protein [Patescibacteria group bacterium]